MEPIILFNFLLYNFLFGPLINLLRALENHLSCSRIVRAPGGHHMLQMNHDEESAAKITRSKMKDEISMEFQAGWCYLLHYQNKPINYGTNQTNTSLSRMLINLCDDDRGRLGNILVNILPLIFLKILDQVAWAWRGHRFRVF